MESEASDSKLVPQPPPPLPQQQQQQQQQQQPTTIQPLQPGQVPSQVQQPPQQNTPVPPASASAAAALASTVSPVVVAPASSIAQAQQSSPQLQVQPQLQQDSVKTSTQSPNPTQAATCLIATSPNLSTMPRLQQIPPKIQPQLLQTKFHAPMQPACSIANSPVISQLGQGPRGPANQMRQPEYLVLLANPRQPGIPNLRYLNPAMNLNQPNILQASQAQTTTMANIQGRHVQLPFSVAGPRAITLANGQTYLSSMPMRHQMVTSRATILQQPTLPRGVAQQGLGVHSVIPTSQSLGLGLQASISPMIQPVNTSLGGLDTPLSTMASDDDLAKGTVFLNKLPKSKSIQNLVQELVDGRKTSEEFTSALQTEMSSSVTQTHLAPFLDKLLPRLRQSLSAGITVLPGIRPPPLQGAQQSQEASSSTISPSKVQSSNSTTKKKKIPLAPGQKSAYALKKEAREAKKKERESLALQGVKVEKVDDKKETEKTDKTPKPKPDKPKRQDKQKKQEKQLESLSSALRDDDDVNDVAAMGGVNLAEESQRIMASGAELVGTQIRSCKDEPFLDTKALATRVARIAKEYNLPEPSKDVVTIISHATQERLKNMVERLGILAEHRSENLKLNPKYEVSTDIKGQIKFLAELDRIEKRRYEEHERQILLKAAKSRSKVEDPEQQKLRQKAKDMQRAEQEEVRQREANETALLAIGPRKKLKTSTASSVSSFVQPTSLRETKPNVDVRGDTIRRVKRVNMRDLQVLLELDRTHLNRLIKMTSQ